MSNMSEVIMDIQAFSASIEAMMVAVTIGLRIIINEAKTAIMIKGA